MKLRVCDAFFDDNEKDPAYFVVTDFDDKQDGFVAGMMFRNGFFSCAFELNKKTLEKMEWKFNLFDEPTRLSLKG